MRKKSLILLTSGILGVSLAGGTFAAWAVTDNASPFKIYVSPGDIQTDDTYFVTLSWGDSQNMGNVGGLELNQYRKAGVLDLRADTSTGGTITAQLSYTVADSYQTGLAQYVVVDVYKGNLDQGAFNAEAYSNTVDYAVGDFAIYNTKVYKCKTAVSKADFNGSSWDEYTIPAKTTFTANKASIEVADNTESLYTVIVSLGNSITSSTYSALSDNEVSIEFDWAKTDDLVGAVFYATGLTGDHVYAYAWDSADETKANKGWPGVEMTPALSDGYYQVAINTTKYNRVIFSNGTVQSGDIVIDTAFDGSGTTYSKNCFNYDGTSGDAKGTFSTHVDVETIYYLVGEKLNINYNTESIPANWALSGYGDDLSKAVMKKQSNGSYTISVTTTEANATLKVFDSHGTWYGHQHYDGHSNENNLVLGEIGTYTITFNPSVSANDYHLSAA